MKAISMCLSILLSAGHAFANQTNEFEQGQTLSQRCVGCHGEAGIATIESNPNLAGQNAEYLSYALKAYRSGERKGGMAFIMRANAASLSDADINALAAYFSSLPGRNATVQKH